MKKYFITFLIFIAASKNYAGGSAYSDADFSDQKLWKKTNIESENQYKILAASWALPGFSDQYKVVSSIETKNVTSIYAEIFNQASLDLQQAETLLLIGDYVKALKISKESLDQVRVKVGINPKAKFQDKFSIDYIVLDELDKKEKMYASFENLNLKIRDGIAMTLSKKSSGYYLDLLNLMKRTNLIYIRAFVESLKKQSANGSLLKRDIEKIRDDIYEISAIPIYFFEPATGKMLLVFDFEVASSDQNYLFNRELFVFMLANQDLFGAKTESDVDKLVAGKVLETRQQFKKDLQQMDISFLNAKLSKIISDPKEIAKNIELAMIDVLNSGEMNYEFVKKTSENIKNMSSDFVNELLIKNPSRLLSYGSCVSQQKCSESKSCAEQKTAKVLINCTVYSHFVSQAKSIDDSNFIYKCLMSESPAAECAARTYALNPEDYDAFMGQSLIFKKIATGLSYRLGMSEMISELKEARYMSEGSNRRYNSLRYGDGCNSWDVSSYNYNRNYNCYERGESKWAEARAEYDAIYDKYAKVGKMVEAYDKNIVSILSQ